MDSIQELVQAEKAAKKMDKLNQSHCLKIVEKLGEQQKSLKATGKPIDSNDLSSLISFYEHQILDLSDLPLARSDYFSSNHCVFCKDKSAKKFKLKSFKEDGKKTTFLFKVCSSCGKWEKLHEAKMIKPPKCKSRTKKRKSNQLNESIKLNRFNLNDLKKLKSTLNRTS